MEPHKQSDRTLALIYKSLRIASIIVLLGFIHLLAIVITKLGHAYSGWILPPYGVFQDGEIIFYLIGIGAIIVIGMLIFLASWLIFLLADASRLREMYARLIGPLVGSQMTPTRTTMVFAGMLVSVIIAFVFLSTWRIP